MQKKTCRERIPIWCFRPYLLLLFNCPCLLIDTSFETGRHTRLLLLFDDEEQTNMEHHLYLLALCVTILLGPDLYDDDHIDRLNRKITVYGLVVLAVVSGSHLINNNSSTIISCWNRANFHEAYIKYTNHICFLTSTYTLEPNEQIPSSIADRWLTLLCCVRCASLNNV
jgi:hypothetical protein